MFRYLVFLIFFLFVPLAISAPSNKPRGDCEGREWGNLFDSLSRIKDEYIALQRMTGVNWGLFIAFAQDSRITEDLRLSMRQINRMGNILKQLIEQEKNLVDRAIVLSIKLKRLSENCVTESDYEVEETPRKREQKK